MFGRTTEKQVAGEVAGRGRAVERHDAVRAPTAQLGARSLALAMLVLGLTMLVMALIAPVDPAPRAAEAAGALATIAGALQLARGAPHNALAAGGLTLLGSLVYLAVTNTEFQAGGVGYSIGVAQFVTVPIGLVLGGAAVALTQGTADARRTARMGDFVPDGAILVVGTILMGIALGQFANERLMPPKWNWISFLGLTVTGMLLLVVGRGAAKAAFRDGPRRTRALVVLATELVLVAGLAVMMYGALNNLVLGANGFETGFRGNGDGLALWAGAAVFLVVVRGGFKLAVADRGGLAGKVASELLYFVGVFAFIVGERSVISGKPPDVPVDGAGFAATVILLGSLFLLVPVRMAAKHSRLRRAGDSEPVSA